MVLCQKANNALASQTPQCLFYQDDQQNQYSC